jgi:hypothetical protein
MFAIVDYEFGHRPILLYRVHIGGFLPLYMPRHHRSPQSRLAADVVGEAMELWFGKLWQLKAAQHYCHPRRRFPAHYVSSGLTGKGEIVGSWRIEGRRLCASMVGGETGEMETGSNHDVSAL